MMNDDTNDTLSTTRKLVLPQCPDENSALAHEVTNYFEQCERKFIEFGYLNVAKHTYALMTFAPPTVEMLAKTGFGEGLLPEPGILRGP